MAKKNLQDVTGSSKGKSDDFNFDFDDHASPFSNFDMASDGNTNTKNNRDPILQTKQGVSAALSSAYSTFIPGMAGRISQNMPEAAKFVGDVGTFTSDVMYMGTKFQQDLAPTISQLKRAGRTLAPRIKQFLPKFAQKKYDSIMSDTDDKARANVKINKEATESSAIASSLDSIFSTQMNAQSEQVADQKADTMLDRALTSKRHGESFQQLQAIRAGTTFHQTFIQNIQIPFMKKDLELKYRHYFVAKDTLAVMQGFAKISEQKLEQIRHNSSLPDIQKLTMKEGIKEAGVQRFSNIITNWQTNMLKKLQSRVLDPFKEGLTMAADAGEMMADMTSTMDSMDGVQGVGAQTGGILGMIGGSQLSKKAGKMLFGDKYGSKGLLSNKAMSMDNLFKNLKTRAALKVQDMADEREGSFLGEMLSLIAPDLVRGGGRTTNTMLKDPDAVSPFTNAVALSISTIMPGYLAKMVKLLEEIKTGQPADELVFDRDSNDFITTSTLQKKFATEAFGSTDQRKVHMSSAIGNIRGIYKAETGDTDLVAFDECIPDLMKFINNSGLAQMKIRPAIIRTFAGFVEEAQANEDDDFDMFSSVETSDGDMRYMRTCFKGVQHTEELCVLLATLLYSSDGTIDKQVYSSLDNVIIDQMMKDGHLEVLNKYLGKYGHARHLKGMISSSGSSFTYDQEAIRAATMAGLNSQSESFQNSVSRHTDSAAVRQAEMKQDVSFKEMLDDPEWNTGILGKIISKSRDVIGDHESGAIKMITEWKGGIKNAWEQDILPAVPKELVEWSKQWAPKAHSKIVEYNASIKSTMNDAAKKSEQVMRHARLKEQRAETVSSEAQALDPFFKGNNQGAMASQMNPRGLQSGMMAALIANPQSFQFPMMPLGKPDDTIIPVKLTNIKEIVDSLAKSIKDTPHQQTVTTTTSIEGGSSVVEAIRQFEAAFKEYAESQKTIPEILNKMLDISGAMSSQLDNLIGNTTGTISKAFGWVKNKGWGFVKKVPGALVTAPWKATKWGAKQAMGAAGWGWDQTKAGRDWVKERAPGAWQATKGGFRNAAGMAGSVVSGGLDLTREALMGGLSGLGLTSDVLAGKLATGAQWLRDRKDGVKTSFKNEIGGLKKSIKNKFKEKVFIDIYLKDKIDPGKPLLSKNKQMDGVYFVDSGKKLLTTYSLNKPVMDAETKDILVTQQDIEHGLVDIDNRSIMGARSFIGSILSGGVGLIGKGISKGKNFIKDVMEGKNPLMGLYGKALGLGLDGIRGIGKGIGWGVKKLFGVSENINVDDLKLHVGDKLDVIIGILQKRFTDDPKSPNEPQLNKQSTGGPRPGDADGDGDRDSQFEDRIKSQEEKEKKTDKKEQKNFYATMKSIKDGLVGGEGKKKKGLLESLMGLLGMGGLLGVAKNIFSTVGMIGTGIFGILKFVGNIGSLLMSAIGTGGKALNWGLDKVTDLFGGGGKKTPSLSGAGGKSFMGKVFGFLGKTGVAGGLLGAATTLATGGSMGDAAMNAGIGAATDVALRSTATAGLRTAAMSGLKTAGVFLLRRAGTALAGIAGGSAAVTIGLAALAAGTIDQVFFNGKYRQSMFNWIGVGTDSFAEERCKFYGIDTSWTWRNLVGKGILRQTIKLEELTYEIGEGKSRALTDSDIESWTNTFGLDNGDPQQVKFWVTWYRKRFLPIFKMYCEALQEEGIQFSNAYDMPEELKKKVLGKVHGQSAMLTKELTVLVPNPDAYQVFKKKYDERKDDKSQSALNANQKAMADQDATNEKTSKNVNASNKYKLTASEAGALAATTGEESKNPDLDWAKTMAGNDPELLRMITGDKPKTAGGFRTFAAENNTGVLPNPGQSGSDAPGGQPGGKIDMSGIPPSASPPSGSGALGSYVSKYESGKKGSAAIGYDKHGGTSYGTYQLSSRMGSLKEFVYWCSKEAPDVYKTLAPIIEQANTGTTTGAFPQAWVDLVKQGKITHELEHRYYVDKFYGRGISLLRKLNPEAAQMVEGNRALQEAMWSTAVQHGPGGAQKLFGRNFKSGILPDAYLRALYADRGTQFPSSTAQVRASVQNRFKSELADMLALNQSKGGSPEDPNKQLTIEGSAPPEGAAPASGDDGSQTKKVSATLPQDPQGTPIGGGGGETVKVTAGSTPGAMGNQEIDKAGAPQMSSSHGDGASGASATSAPVATPTSSSGDIVKLVSDIAMALQELLKVNQQTPGFFEKILALGTELAQKSTPAPAMATASPSGTQNGAVQKANPFIGNVSTAKLRRS